jgi:4-hydroxybenzoate polyprenyltransferase
MSKKHKRKKRMVGATTASHAAPGATLAIGAVPRRAIRLAYAQLLRIPNVFTAIADILVGFMITHSDNSQIGTMLSLVASSSCLYCSGMALNDYFDRRVDARERPRRPIPSGRVLPHVARQIGWTLLITGVVLAWLVAAFHASARPGIVATILAVTIWFYNRHAKKYAFGPVVMGCCRMLNVLLGMSLLAGPWQPIHHAIADGIGLYIVGVTWFAKGEAGVSPRPHLIGATLVILAALTLLYGYPVLSDMNTQLESVPELAFNMGWKWRVLWGVIALMILHRCCMAIWQPIQYEVQRAVKVCLLSLIIIDASVVLGETTNYEALFILALLIPMLILGRWVYST